MLSKSLIKSNFGDPGQSASYIVLSMAWLNSKLLNNYLHVHMNEMSAVL